MQLFNQVCCRILDDGFNIFWRLFDSYWFIIITAIEIAGQAIIVQLTGPVFHCVYGGLDGAQWGICIGLSAISWVVNLLLKFIPDTLFFAKGKGQLEISKSKVLSIKKDQDSKKGKIDNNQLAKKLSSIIPNQGSKNKIGKNTSKKKQSDKQPSMKGDHISLKKDKS